MRPRIQSQMFNPKIKRSIATLSILLSLAIQANAGGATGLVKREDASSPYILESYSCDLSRLKRREDGSTFGRVQTSPNSIALAVTPESHEAVLFTGDRAFQSYFENSPETKNMRSKVKKFEDEGNIPAMKHWDEKLRAELLYKKTYFRQSAITKYISKQNEDKILPIYYKPDGGSKLYPSFEEMDNDYQSYCNFGLQR
jgi:hypothetical protein